jgi:hypothetical protein
VGVTVTAKNKRVQLAAGAGMTFVVGALKTVKPKHVINGYIRLYNIHK